MAWNTSHDLSLTLAQTSDVKPQDTPAAPPPAANGDGAAPGETTGADGKALGPDGEGGGGGTGFGNMLPIFLLVLVVMWIFLMGGQRKEKKKRAALLASLAKGDKVQTVGGVLGTVVEVRDAEVIVKVDENSNARMRFSRSAIQSVINEDEDGGGSKEK